MTYTNNISLALTYIRDGDVTVEGVTLGKYKRQIYSYTDALHARETAATSQVHDTTVSQNNNI